MSDFNSTFRGISDTVTRTAGNVLDTTKAFAKRSSITLKIRDKYTELGRVCYEMHEKGTDETGKMKKLIGEINLLKSDLRVAEEESGLKKICPACGTQNKADNCYCIACGKML